MRRSTGCAGKCPAMQAMSTPAAHAPVTLTIASVERDTGLSKDTLRVWERRYGFPVPDRDVNGERLYPADQVERLRRWRAHRFHHLKPACTTGPTPHPRRRRQLPSGRKARTFVMDNALTYSKQAV